METDPAIVARLAAERREENWQFRTFLTSCSRISDARLNTLARRFGEEAARRIDCLSCGACCRDIVVPLVDEEIAAMARCKGMAESEFRRRYVRRTDEHDAAFDVGPCPLQEGTACTVYPCRPEPCRGYPYIGSDVRSHSLAILERAATCPIVFQMLERLKDELHFRRLCE